MQHTVFERGLLVTMGDQRTQATIKRLSVMDLAEKVAPAAVQICLESAIDTARIKNDECRDCEGKDFCGGIINEKQQIIELIAMSFTGMSVQMAAQLNGPESAERLIEALKGMLDGAEIAEMIANSTTNTRG